MVDTAKLVARVQTKGVTKATSELDKFDKSANEAEDSTINLGKAAKKAGGFILKAGAVMGAAATAMVLIANRSADAQREWKTLSNIAGDSITEFQGAAFAAEQVGISAEKLADISKDTNEKLGEFIATGGGGFKDFFENVAPLVGLTAEELEGLSGPQVLGKVKNAMDEANVSLEQQSFFLESIASDTTNLIPLLANEGAELERLTNKYNELNSSLALTGTADKAISELAEDFDLLGKTATNSINYITGVLAPDISKFINFITAGMPKATQAVANFFDEFRDPENRQSILSIQESIKDNLKEIDRISRFVEDPGSEENVVNLRNENIELEKRLKLLQKEAEIVSGPDVGFKETLDGGDPFAKELDRRKKQQDEIDQKEKERLDKERESLDLRRKMARDYEDAELESEQNFQDRRKAAIDQGFNDIISLSGTKNNTLFKISQAAAIAQATLKAPEIIQNALAVPPYPLGVALAAAAAISTGANIAAIASTKPPSARAQGGQFDRGQDLLVGEKGPELVRFNSGGRIANATDTAGMGGGGSVPVKIINQTSAKIDNAQATLSKGEVVVIVRETVNSDLHSPNSQLNKGLDSTRDAPRLRS